MRLETERLVLRDWEQRDRAQLIALHSDPHVRRFFFPSSLTEEQAGAILDKARAKLALNGYHFGAAELRETGEFAGMIGIGLVPQELRDVIPTRPAVEVGWMLHSRFWGQGLAVEGASAWLAHAWSVLELDEVVAFTAVVNLPSQRVMQKLGMVRDPAGDFEHPNVPQGNPLRPHVLYRIANPGR